MKHQIPFKFKKGRCRATGLCDSWGLNVDHSLGLVLLLSLFPGVQGQAGQGWWEVSHGDWMSFKVSELIL